MTALTELLGGKKQYEAMMKVALLDRGRHT